MREIIFQALTGESAQHISSRVVPPSPGILFCADPAQQHLESIIFHTFSQITWRSAHPLHVSRIRLEKGEFPIVFIDGAAEITNFARYFLNYALPVVESGGGLVSNPGVRILSVQGRNLLVGLVGTGAKIVVRCAAGVDWDAIRADYIRDVKGHGIPLCFEKEITEHESEFIIRDGFANIWLTRDPLVEMESKLLRRVGVFTEFSSAHATYGYRSGRNIFKMNFDFGDGIEKNHDQLLEALIDPDWGLGMHVSSYRCSCFNKQYCSINLSTGSRDAILALHFSSDDSHCGRSHYEKVGSADRWICKVFA